MDLSDFGWNSFMEKNFEEYKNDFVPARVIRDSRGVYSVLCGHGELTARVSGSFINDAASKSAYPVVGDWVALKALPDEEAGIISAVLPRKTGFSRKAASEVTEEQVVAANIDTVFLVNGLDDNFNLRRIERYLTLVWDSGANPVIILNKSDLCEDVDDYIGRVEEIAIGATVISTSAAGGINIDQLRKYTGKGKTVAFLGSSGVGKSSLINRLLGEDRLRVNEVREGDSKGRHTTTHKELILLPDGGALIDTPGMRELQLWIDAESLSKTFEDVEEFAAACKFTDCRHDNEPGCAIREALESGELDEGRYKNYLKMKRELSFLNTRRDQKARQAERDKWKKIHTDYRNLVKFREKNSNK